MRSALFRARAAIVILAAQSRRPRRRSRRAEARRMETIRVDLYRPRENAVVVSLRGELGAEPTPELSRRMLEVLEDRPATIVLDCADVTRLGSRGLAEIVRLQEAAARYGGSVRIASARPEHVRLMRALRLDSTTPVFGSVQDALIYVG